MPWSGARRQTYMKGSAGLGTIWRCNSWTPPATGSLGSSSDRRGRPTPSTCAINVANRAEGQRGRWSVCCAAIGSCGGCGGSVYLAVASAASGLVGVGIKAVLWRANGLVAPRLHCHAVLELGSPQAGPAVSIGGAANVEGVQVLPWVFDAAAQNTKQTREPKAKEGCVREVYTGGGERGVLLLLLLW